VRGRGHRRLCQQADRLTRSHPDQLCRAHARAAHSSKPEHSLSRGEQYDTQWQWERDTLYPIAGIDPSLADLNHRITQLDKLLAYARIDAARAHLDGTRSGAETIAWLQEFTFATADEARRSLSFFETYRSYVVKYRLGEDPIQQHIDKVAGADPKAR
jgi:hypothetical protein